MRKIDVVILLVGMCITGFSGMLLGSYLGAQKTQATHEDAVTYVENFNQSSKLEMLIQFGDWAESGNHEAIRNTVIRQLASIVRDGRAGRWKEFKAITDDDLVRAEAVLLKLGDVR